jgi:hypothetical protein
VHILFKSWKSRAEPNELPGIATATEWSYYREKKCNLMELLQRGEMQLNGAGAERKNVSEWSSCREKKGN